MIEKNLKPLSKCTDDEIEAEAERRRAFRIKNKSNLKFCDECVHFRINYSGKEIPDDELMKACNLGHKTNFIMPEFPHGDDWGFYRTQCLDREMAVNSKWPWQIEQEEIGKNKQRMEWNDKLLQRRLKLK